MFESTNTTRPLKRRLWSLGLSLLAHAVVISVLVILPLIYYQILPQPEIITFLMTEPPPPPPLPPPVPPSRRQPVAAPRPVQVERFVAPTEIPKTVPAPASEPAIVSVPAIPEGIMNEIEDGIAGGVPGGVVGGIPGGLVGSPPQPMLPPPPPPAPKQIQPLIVSSALQQSKLIHVVEPEYPSVAKQARITGNVVLRITVDESGSVSSVQVVSGHPILVPAAVAAVRQWKYSPTILNGEPVPVIANVTVTFSLRQN